MTDPTLPAFYTEHVPQSEYRRTSEVRSRGDRTRLDVEIPSLSLSDPALAKAIRDKIIAEDVQLRSILLPQSVSDKIEAADYLSPVFQKLGL